MDPLGDRPLGTTASYQGQGANKEAQVVSTVRNLDVDIATHVVRESTKQLEICLAIVHLPELHQIVAILALERSRMSMICCY